MNWIILSMVSSIHIQIPHRRHSSLKVRDQKVASRENDSSEARLKCGRFEARSFPSSTRTFEREDAMQGFGRGARESDEHSQVGDGVKISVCFRIKLTP